MEKLFENATRLKVRFEYKGMLSAEELWDLNVKELDDIYKSLNAVKKQTSEESLLGVKTTENALLTLKMDIVKHIVETKLEAAQNAVTKLEKAEKKNKIMAILASKQDSALERKSVKDLNKMLEDL